MLKCRLSILMGEKRLNMQDIHEKTGLSRNTITNLYHEKATRIDFNTIEKICDLLGCEVGDLLQKG